MVCGNHFGIKFYPRRLKNINLLAPGLITDPICLRCRQGNEDLEHILFYCPFATVVWQEMGITSLHASVNDFVALMQDDKRRHVLGMLMGIWFSRNRTVWKLNSMLADRLVHYVDEFLRCWKGAHMVHTSQLVHHPVVDGGDVCWWKPTTRMLKCNVARAIFVDTGHMGWAVVVPNDAGGFVRCISGVMKINSVIL